MKRLAATAALALSGAAASAAPAALPAATVSAASDRAARPNIVVVVADDWGMTDVGAFGGEIATPTIDALAREGVRFANFHVAASCAPTRSMLLTGVDNHRNGVGNLLETMPAAHRGQPGYLGSLDTNVVTVASLLHDNGYRTYITGKWNVGTERHNLPDRRGFDRSIVQGDTGSDNFDPQQRYLPHSDKVHWFEDGREPQMPPRFYSSEYFVDRMIEYLRSGQSSGRPFFAYLGFQANHVPLQAPREFIDRYAGRYDAGWAALRAARRDRAAALGLVPPATALAPVPLATDWNTLDGEGRRLAARRMEVYAGMAEAMDFHLGRLVAHLKQSGEYARTVFVFLSDNGPEGSDYREARLWLATQYRQDLDHLGGPGAYAVMGPGWAGAAASPFATYKFYAGEGALRSPLVIAGVPGAAAGRVHAGLTHVLDVVPTLLDLAQVRHPGSTYQGRPIEPLAGRSLLPALADPARPVRSAEETLGYELSGNAAFFRGDLKLVRNLPPVGDGQWHLHDLAHDPGETHDLQQERPADFQALRAAYDDWARAHHVLPMPEGYSPARQVLINSFLNYWIPAYRAPVLAALAAVVIALGGWRWRRARGVRP